MTAYELTNTYQWTNNDGFLHLEFSPQTFFLELSCLLELSSNVKNRQGFSAGIIKTVTSKKRFSQFAAKTRKRLIRILLFY